MQKTLIILILLGFVSTFSQTDEKDKLKQSSQIAVDLYNVGKYDEAVKFAQQSLELSLKIFGSEDVETAATYTNLGIIQRGKGKYKESAQNIQKALDIYQKQSEPKSEKIVEMLQILGGSQLLDKKNKEAEISYLKASEIAETKLGGGKNNLTPFLNLANFYSMIRNFTKADEYYLKSVEIANKTFGSESKEMTKVSDSRLCYNAFDKKRDDQFRELQKKLLGKSDGDPNSVVVNGKALNLVKPAYPPEAKEIGLSGEVKIKVKIDEQGNVTTATPVCGNGFLERASEEAARKSKFSPTLLNGKPVNVTGIIVYRFARN